MISVIVPVYDVEPYLRQCVDSILAQTFTDFELILVDDGSPDNCGAICDEYAKKDRRVHVIHQANGGLSAARNAGLDWMFANSNSRYVTFIDSDDWVHVQYLELLLHEILEYNVEVSVCTFKRPTKHSKEREERCKSIKSEKLTAEELLIKHEWDYNYACGKLYQRDLFRNIRYPVGKNFEDTLTTYRVLFSANKKEIVWIDQPLYFYFLNEAGITRSPWTPRELTVFDGIRAQIDYYRSNGYERALEKEQWLYVNHFAYQLCRIRENSAAYKSNRKYFFKLRSEMMRIIHENPDKYGYHKMPWCYEAAYPRLMRMYHMCGKIVKGILHKKPPQGRCDV